MARAYAARFGRSFLAPFPSSVSIVSSLPRPDQARRQETIDALCDAFARDAMDLAEFERRVDVAHRAGTAAELDRLLSDLGRTTPLARAGSHPAESAPGSSRPATAPFEPVRARELVAGILGGSMRRGRWTPARRVTAIATMGGVELDFREAVLAPGVTEVRVFAVWGGVQIVAPPHVRVECSGVGIMGGFDHRDDSRSVAEPGAAVLRITGLAVMGGVEVVVRRPGESRRDARRRMKRERRQGRLRSDSDEEER